MMWLSALLKTSRSPAIRLSTRITPVTRGTTSS